jgi:hypothetical protein
MCIMLKQQQIKRRVPRMDETYAQYLIEQTDDILRNARKVAKRARAIKAEAERFLNEQR